MAHKVLSSDMAELINAMKMAQKYSTTTLDQEYRRGMLSAAHVLAVDAKHLFDVVDEARKNSAKLSSSAWWKIWTRISFVQCGKCDARKKKLKIAEQMLNELYCNSPMNEEEFLLSNL